MNEVKLFRIELTIALFLACYFKMIDFISMVESVFMIQVIFSMIKRRKILSV